MDFLKSAAAAYQQHANKDDEDKPATTEHTTQQTTQQSAPQSSAAPSDADVKDAHDKVYQQGNIAEASEEELGKAAGVQAFKEYEKEEQSDRSEEGGGQAKLMQMVMTEVQKLMSGGGGGQNQSEVIKNAIAMATKLFMSKSGGSGGSGGGLGSLMSNPQVAAAMENPQVQSMLKKFM